jgi:hypothetical protein
MRKMDACTCVLMNQENGVSNRLRRIAMLSDTTKWFGRLSIPTTFLRYCGGGEIDWMAAAPSFTTPRIAWLL